MRAAHVIAFASLIATAASGMPAHAEGVATAPAIVAAAATASPEIRVMSFNLRQDVVFDLHNAWMFRRDLLVETIEKYGPDVLSTQECKAGMAEFLKQKLEGYTFVGAGRDDGKSGGEMCGVFVRNATFTKLDAGHFWLSTTPEKPGSKSWGSWFTRMATWVKVRHKATGQQMVIVNTHLDSNSARAREEQAKFLRARAAKISGGLPVVITGDFNTGEATLPYKTLVSVAKGSDLSLADSYRAVNTKRSEEEATHHGFSGNRKGDRIDWILVTPQFTPVAATIERRSDGWRYPSDHFPVTATLKLNVAAGTLVAKPSAGGLGGN